MQHINLAVIGVGPRGYGLLSTLLDMEDVHIKAVCDIRQERVERAQKLVRDKAEYTPDGFTEWEQALEMPDLDAVIIATPWFLHIPVTIAAMQRGTSRPRRGWPTPARNCAASSRWMPKTSPWPRLSNSPARERSLKTNYRRRSKRSASIQTSRIQRRYEMPAA